MTAERTIYSSFSEYRERDAEEPANPVNGTIYAIDTNVLLNLFKFTSSTTKNVLAALSHMSGELFVPHQTLAEFWPLLEEVRAGSHHREAKGKIETSVVEAERVVRQWLTRTGLEGTNQQDKIGDRAQEHLGTLADAGDMLVSLIEEVQSEAVSDEWVLKDLDKALHGRVGPAPTGSEHSALIKRFEQRVQDGVPPGNRDAEIRKGNAEKAAGDFLIWQQCLDEGRRRFEETGVAPDLTLITNDLKDDWVRSRGADGGVPLGRRELVREYAENTGGGIFRIRTFRNLLDIASDHFGAEISETARDQVSARSDATSGSWTKETARDYLVRLLLSKDQHRVLLAAYAASIAGQAPITAEEAKLVAGRDNLASFSSPYKSAFRRSSVVREGGITAPMIDRQWDPEVGQDTYVLVGDPEDAIAAVLSADEQHQAVFEQLAEFIASREDETTI